MKRQHHDISSSSKNNDGSTCSSPSWWSQIAGEIRSEGGQVRDDLIRFDETNRNLFVIETAQSIEPDTVLLEIPVANMVTQEKALHLCPWLEHLLKEDKTINFYNSRTDVLLAIAMASSSKDDLSYLRSLPDSAAFNALPRRWNDDTIQELLGNTSVVERVQAAKAGARQDYEALQKIVFQTKTKSLPTADFPSFQEFDDMLAAVISRAFQIGQAETDVALVPLLDLCNHSRGKEMIRNVLYQIIDVNDERKGKNSIKKMVVKSVTSLKVGDVLTLTYGALGNSQLLLNYGFCIADNVEPDGSSNDVLEWKVELHGGRKTSSVVPLRAGPKAYSYSGFTKAVESFLNNRKASAEVGEDIDTGGEDDFECFLNDTGEKEPNEGEKAENDDFDSLYKSGGHSNVESSKKEFSDDDDDDDDFTQLEMEALRKLHTALGEQLQLLSAPSASPSSNTTGPSASATMYASLLRQSERRTLHFFARAAEKVHQKLEGSGKKDVNDPSPFGTCCDVSTITSAEDLKLIEEQTSELAKVYVRLKNGI